MTSKRAACTGVMPVHAASRFLSIAVAIAAAAMPLSGVSAAPAGAVSAAAIAAPASGQGIADFYRARASRPLWLAPANAAAADELIALLGTAQADGLNPKKYNNRNLVRSLRSARSGNPQAIQRAETLLSSAFVAYARDLQRAPDVGIKYVDSELLPQPLSPRALLEQAASAPSLSDYVSRMGWMNPFYADLRRAMAARQYRTEAERRLLQLNLERARSLPGGTGRFVVVNAPAQRLYMFEGGRVVDSMRVVVGKPVHATPMMTAYIRYAALNPYWNVPPDLAAERIAPNVVSRGTGYLREKGYQLLSDWSDRARVVSPSSVDWKAVAAGRTEVRLRQLPGAGNAMGRMKFMFPNAEGVYLHDTPDKELLTEASRLFSGGCVRLEDAPRLGEWLFGRRLNPKGARPEQKVPLPRPVPVYLTYLTAVPSGSQIAYYDDIYGRDRARLAQLGGRSVATR